MRIVQIILPGASEYERKSQRLDFLALSPDHEVSVATSPRSLPSADLAHVYGLPHAAERDFIGFPLPYVSGDAPRVGRFSFRVPAAPAAMVSPLKNGTHHHLPEAVDAAFLDAAQAPAPSPKAARAIGYFRGLREPAAQFILQAIARLHRFREDLTAIAYDHGPTPQELAASDVWVDPSVDDTDYDGFVAEALAMRRVVVASRTPINLQRLENGRVGFLVPAGDPNELAHAILTALFKPEIAHQKTEAARQTLSKFHPRHRQRALIQVYDTIR